MDGNTSISLALLIAIIGSLIGVYGFISKRDAKKFAEGEQNGALRETLKTMNATLEHIKSANEEFQRDHKQEHREIDNRLRKVENEQVKFARAMRIDSGE